MRNTLLSVSKRTGVDNLANFYAQKHVMLLTIMLVELCQKRNLFPGFLTRSDTNQTVQSQKMAGDLKLGKYEEEKPYYL